VKGNLKGNCRKGNGNSNVGNGNWKCSVGNGSGNGNIVNENRNENVGNGGGNGTIVNENGNSFGNGDSGDGNGNDDGNIIWAGSPPQSTTIATETSGGVASASASASGNGSDHSNVPVAVIVGGVIGGILLILSGVFLLLRWRRKARKRMVGDVNGGSDSNMRTRAIDPLIIGVPPIHSSPDCFSGRR